MDNLAASKNLQNIWFLAYQKNEMVRRNLSFQLPPDVCLPYNICKKLAGTLFSIFNIYNQQVV